MAGIPGGFIQGLIGGDSFLSQIFIYSAAQQILQPLLAPYAQQLLNDVQEKTPVIPLSPADLADMVVRGVLTEEQARPAAAIAGINAENFHYLVLNTGEPPGLETVLQWYRRGIIGWADTGPNAPSVERAIKTSRLKDYWNGPIQDGQWLPITVADTINAWVRHQVSDDDAYRYLKANGIRDPEATILRNTNGRPPAPGQLGELVNRGVIPIKGVGPGAISFEQGISESDVKDKWEPFLESLIVKLPGIFEIRLMQQQGALTADQAYRLYKEEGLQDDLAQSATSAGSVAKTAKAKQLAESTVEKLYLEGIISKDDTLADLEKLGFDAAEANYIVEVWDYSQHAKVVSSAVSAIRTRFIGRRIGAEVATSLLKELGFTDAQIGPLLDVWSVELAAQVKVLTVAEILDAAYYNIASPDWALAELEQAGYSPADAWVMLSVKMKARQPNPPDTAPPAPAAAPA